MGATGRDPGRRALDAVEVVRGTVGRPYLEGGVIVVAAHIAGGHRALLLPSRPTQSRPASNLPASNSPASNSPASNSPASNSPASNRSASNRSVSSQRAGRPARVGRFDGRDDRRALAPSWALSWAP